MLDNIDNKVLSIKGLKDDDRKTALKELSNMIYSYLKEQNFKDDIITNDTLKSFFVVTDDRTARQLKHDITLILISENKLKITESKKPCIRLLRDNIKSQDTYRNGVFNGCIVVNNKSIRKSTFKYKVLGYQIL